MSADREEHLGGRPWYLRRYLPVALTLVAGLLLSTVAFLLVRSWERGRIAADFERDSRSIAVGLRTAIARHLETLYFLQEFYAATRTVQRAEFEAFVRDAMRRHRGYQALEWIPRVPASARQQFEQAVRTEGFPDFRIRPRTDRDECFPVDFVVPYAGNEKAHGYDLASDPQRLEALERARDTGQMVATAPIRLVQEVGEQLGFLVYVPVYQNGSQRTTVAERRSALAGFVLGVFRIGDLINSALAGLDTEGIDFHVCDQTDAEHPAVLYRCRSATAGWRGRPGGEPDNHRRDAGATNLPALFLQDTLDVAGRRWSLEFHPAPDSPTFEMTWLAHAVLGASGLFAVLLAGYVGALVGRSTRVNRLVERRTSELSLANRQLQQEMHQRQRAQEVLRRNLERQVRLNHLFQEDLPQSESLREKLQKITDTVVEVFGADFCRIWATAPGDLCDAGCMHAQVTEGPHVCRYRDRCLHLLASAGRYTHVDGEVHRRVPFGCYKIGRVAASEDPKFLTNDVQHDPRVHNHEWARELGLVSFAGYRLCATDGTPIGVLALFAKHPIDPEDDNLLEGLAASTSHVIQTAGAEQELRKAYDEPEARVQERTAQLAQANRDLQVEIAERTQAEQSLRESEERYRHLFEELNDAAFLADVETGRILETNRQAETLLGRPRAEIVGMHQAELHPASRADEYRMKFAAHIERGKAADFDSEVTRKDGTSAPVRVSAAPLNLGGRSLVLGLFQDITERKRAEDALQEEKSLLRSLVDVMETMDVGLTIQDREYNITYQNSFMQKQFDGLDGSKLGRKCYEVYEQQPKVCDGCPVEKAFRDGQPHSAERTTPAPGGGVFYWDNTAHPIRNTAGEITSCFEVARNITERKRAEEELRESEVRLRTILESVQTGLLIVDADSHVVVEANPAALQMIGAPKESVVGHICHRHVCPAEQGRCPITDLGQTVDSSERVLLTADGQSIPILKTVTTMTLKGRRYLLESFGDLRERKAAEEQTQIFARQQSAVNALLRIGLEDAPLEQILERCLDEILFNTWLTLAPRGGIFLVETEESGSTPQDRGHPALVLVAHRNLPDPVHAACKRVPFGHCLCGRAAATGQTVFADRVDPRHETTYPDMQPHGHYCVPIRSGDRVVGVLAVYVNEGHQRSELEEGFLETVSNTIAGIIERKQVEQRLRDSEERHRTITQAARDAIITADATGIIRFWNPAAERIFRYSAEEAVGRDMMELIVPPQHHEAKRRGLAEFARTGCGAAIGKTLELTALRKDGSEFPIQISVSAYRDGDRYVAVALIHDITERKRAEAELEATHRELLEASWRAGRAEIAAGVLHNVGNVLNSVNVSAGLVASQVRQCQVSNLAKAVQLLREHADDLPDFLTRDEKGKRLPQFLYDVAQHLLERQGSALGELESLTANIEHLKNIVSTQQSYAGVSGVVETVVLAEVLEDALRINAAALVRHGIELHRQYAEVPPLTLDKHKLLQILVNLVRNAKYALCESDRPDRQLTVRLASPDAERVRIEVCDNGVGISKENLTRIFSAGFTTRADGHGFGLHVSALAAREMGGSLTAHSDGPGRGATLTLELPLTVARATSPVPTEVKA